MEQLKLWKEKPKNLPINRSPEMSESFVNTRVQQVKDEYTGNIARILSWKMPHGDIGNHVDGYLIPMGRAFINKGDKKCEANNKG